MKKLITLALIIGATTFIEAQSNLVFNQAIILELSSAGATVPEGKIWKVTYGTSGFFFDVNGQSWSIGGAGSHKTTPLWFPEGSVFTRNTGSNRLELLNILEFNVVPISSSGSGGSVGGVSADGFIVNGIIDLDFSYVNNTGSIGGSVDMGSLIVPEGKIWKIVISNFNGSTNSGDIPGSGFGGNVYVNNYLVTGEEKPIYLAAGTYQVFGVPAASGGGGTYYYTVKVGGIEYNTN